MRSIGSQSDVGREATKERRVNPMLGQRPACRLSMQAGTRRATWLTLALLAALALTGGAARAAASASDIKMGVLLSLSGFGASYGQSLLQGIRMAADEINEAGGINGRRITLDIADDDSDPAQSVLAMQRLINDHVDFVLGGWGSSMVLADMAPAERAGMPYIVVGASNPHITTSRNKWTFRVLTNDSTQAADLATIAVKTLHMKRIALINDTNDYGVGLRDILTAALAKLGVKPVAVQSYQSNDKDFTAQLTHILAAQPDGLGILGTLPAAAAIMNQARDMGITARFFGAAGLGTEALIALAPDASEGTVATQYFQPMDRQAKAWVAAYVKEFAHAAQPPRPSQAAWGYRALKLIIAPCLEQAGTDRNAFRLCLAHWRGKIFGLPSAEAYFDATNQLVVPLAFVTVKDKRFVLLPGQQ
jgi:branched-chain amino acid transport system substrate-binding protein